MIPVIQTGEWKGVNAYPRIAGCSTKLLVWNQIAAYITSVL